MKPFFLVLLLFFFASCSDNKPGPSDSGNNSSGTEQSTPQQPLPKADIQVAWERYFPPNREVLDYTQVNPSLAVRIEEALQQPGEAIKDLPKLRDTRLKVDDKVYALYPHTIVDLEAKKFYRLENVYKDLYKDWMKYVLTTQEEIDIRK